MMEINWPSPSAFLDLAMVEQSTDGVANCTAIAVCDADGNPCRSFCHGQEAHFFFEFEVHNDIGVPSGGLEFHNVDGFVIYGKNSFQFDLELPHSIERGKRLRFHQAVHLDVGPGDYWFTAGFASTDASSYRNYTSGAIGHEQFAETATAHCVVVDAGSFAVRLEESGKLRHYGAANLKGVCRLSVVHAAEASFVQAKRTEPAENAPTIIHVTHWKAGSQWIHKLLIDCAHDRIVTPELDQSQFLHSPIQSGKIYPTVYVTKVQFDRVHLPPNTHRFVIIRDLRDTLISGYFSMKNSHPNVNGKLSHLRNKLQQLSQEDGLSYMLENWLPGCANIQSSWIAAGEPLIRYSSLLERDEEILEAVLIDRCQLPIEREQFRRAVLANRFETVTGGRARGDENLKAHERKGVPGDWRSYFTEPLKRRFKDRYGALLVAGGY